MKLVLLLPFLVFQLASFSQIESPVEKSELLWKQGRLDSAEIEITIYNRQNQYLDSIRILHVFKDTIVDSSGIFHVGNSILDLFWSYNKVKYGIWTTYYPNGSIKSIGHYSVGATFWCQVFGPSTIGYSIKTGNWIYYYINGVKMAEGEYDLIYEEWDNNCGVDAYFGHVIDEDWQFWDNLGNSIHLNEELENIVE